MPGMVARQLNYRPQIFPLCSNVGLVFDLDLPCEVHGLVAVC